MRKIIDKKLYDTQKAIELTSDSNNLSTRDFKWYHETLYKTHSGRYFLYGQGGAQTRWFQKVGDSYIEGKDIVALDKVGAMLWLEKHNAVSTILSEFGDDIEEA